MHIHIFIYIGIYTYHGTKADFCGKLCISTNISRIGSVCIIVLKLLIIVGYVPICVSSLGGFVFSPMKAETLYHS